MQKKRTTMRTFFLLTLMTIFFSCYQANEKSVEKQSKAISQKTEYLNELMLYRDVEIKESENILKINPEVTIREKDTIIRFTFKGKTKEYLIEKRDFEFIFEFQRFIYNVGDVFKYKKDGYIDITGDGNKNYYSTLIEQRPKGFLIKNIIEDNNEIVWLDSLLVDDRFYYLYLLSDGDSLFNDTKPYSYFYTAYKGSRNFIDTIGKHPYKSNRDLHLLWLNNYVYDPEYWTDYIENFKGRTFHQIGFAAPNEYIWDSRAKKFVPINIP